MAKRSRREFGVLLASGAGALLFPVQAAAALGAGYAGSFPFVPMATGRCSFCHRAEGVVFVKAGPISICSECIALCTELITEEDRVPGGEQPPEQKPSFDLDECTGLDREGIAARLLESGLAAGALGSAELERQIDHLEVRLRWGDWKPGFTSADRELMCDPATTRDQLAELVLARGWPGTRDEPVFEKLLDLLEKVPPMVGKEPEPLASPPPPPPGTPKGALYCSFCGRTQDEVRKVIAGPSVYICDGCVDRADKLRRA